MKKSSAFIVVCLLVILTCTVNFIFAQTYQTLGPCLPGSTSSGSDNEYEAFDGGGYAIVKKEWEDTADDTCVGKLEPNCKVESSEEAVSHSETTTKTYYNSEGKKVGGESWSAHLTGRGVC